MKYVTALVVCLVGVLAVFAVAPIAGAQEPVVVQVAPVELQLAVGASSDVAVEVVGVEGLYGFDVQLTFDPAIVEVVDADPDRPGVQVSLGRMLDPGMSVRDGADNTAGTIHYAMTQLNPSEAKSGTGNLIVIKLRAKAAGSTDLAITSVDLARRDATEIPSAPRSGVVVVAAGAAAQPTNTPIPTQAPPTAAPTGLSPATAAAAVAATTAAPVAQATATPTALFSDPPPTPVQPATATLAVATSDPSATPTLTELPATATPPPAGDAEHTATPSSTPAAAGDSGQPGESTPTAPDPAATAQPAATPQAVAAAEAVGSQDGDSATPARERPVQPDDAPGRTLLTVGLVALAAALVIGGVLAVLLMARRRTGSP